MGINAESHRYHSQQAGSTLWYVYDAKVKAPGIRIIAEVFTKQDADMIVRALRISDLIRSAL